MIDLFNIKDNVAVITGGTGVLGRAIAKYLALNGARVIILGRKEDVGKIIVSDIYKALAQQVSMISNGIALGGSVEFMKTDVMNQQLYPAWPRCYSSDSFWPRLLPLAVLRG